MDSIRIIGNMLKEYVESNKYKDKIILSGKDKTGGEILFWHNNKARVAL